MALEGVHRLIDKRDAIRQEQDTLDPITTYEKVAEGNHCPRLARSRGHHEQRLAIVVALERLRDAANGAGLVVPLHDGGADRSSRQWLTSCPALNQKLQLCFL